MSCLTFEWGCCGFVMVAAWVHVCACVCVQWINLLNCGLNFSSMCQRFVCPSAGQFAVSISLPSCSWYPDSSFHTVCSHSRLSWSSFLPKPRIVHTWNSELRVNCTTPKFRTAIWNLLKKSKGWNPIHFFWMNWSNQTVENYLEWKLLLSVAGHHAGCLS